MMAVTNGMWATVPGNLMSNLPQEGVGVFETLRWRNHAAEFWPEHWQRFQAGCRWFGLHPDISETRLRELTHQLAARNELVDGIVRYAAWRTNDGAEGWRLESSLPRAHMLRPELKVTLGPGLPPPDDARAYKHLGRTLWFEAVNDARRRGIDEVLLTDGANHIVEGAVSNAFVVRDGTVYTTPLTAGPLPGIVRAAVIELAGRIGKPLVEAPITIEDARTADELWLTNSLIGIRPVERLDQHVYPLARPCLDAFRAAWQNAYGCDPTR